MTYTAPFLRTANTTPPRGAARKEQWAVPMDEDLVLMRRVAAGDRQAFESLYRRYAPRLAGMHYRPAISRTLTALLLVFCLFSAFHLTWYTSLRYYPPGNVIRPAILTP